MPNILLLLADQFRFDCLGCAGIRNISTPNLDALASRGVRFSRAFTPVPVCAPARQALLSGLDPDSFGAGWNYDFLPTKTLAPGATWSEALRDAGYSVGFVGKWHNSMTNGPHDFGYADVVDNSGYGAMIKEKYGDISYSGGWFGCASPVALEDSHTHWLAARASEMLSRFASGDKPWHIRVDFSDPHLPCRPSEPFASMYDPVGVRPWPGVGDTFEEKPYIHRQQTVTWGLDGLTWEDFAPMVARYQGQISQLDDACGIILRALEQSGQTGDTIVVFTSDHGDMCGSHGMLDKHYVLYDDITRVPLVAAGPGIARGEVRDEFAMNCLDLSPTLRELAGLPQIKTHGASLVPLLRGESAPEGWRDFAVSSGNGQQFGLYTTRCIRTDRYKYVWNLTDTDEFYDLESDPGEKKNLIREVDGSDLLAELRKKLYGALKAQEDIFALTGWLDCQLLEGRKLLRGE